ncbi:hypothetical protein AKJ35_00775 [candidate division MSBL1 archaeon SCGC-AAA833F18]|uniref:Transglutaminase-like domain-containing protein n=1 Tax=candidate division MSBL1 archaeon SCGC-AAA833F18 TaxID=1698257 RepID=A0A133VSQ0_9EURY|nr:hypothetical protein AKJ35_00775 [candidate division MSBL1 archaeon SCGC-AAA833F18]
MRKLLILALLILLITAIHLPTVDASESSESAIYEVRKEYVIKNYGQNQALEENVSFYLLDNREIIGQQILSENIEVEGSYKGIQIYATEDNRRARVVELDSMDPGETKTVEVTYILKVDSVPQIDPELVGNTHPSSVDKFTKAVEGIWNSNDSRIRDKAHELTKNENNYWYKAKRIFDFVQEHLKYKPQSVVQGDIWAYLNKEGDCSEYAFLFISLARAAEIPTKFVGGYLYSFAEAEASPTGLANYGHAFALVYLPKVGWIPVDPTESGQGGGYFAELPVNHIVELTSDGSNLRVGETSETPPADVHWTQYSGQGTTVDFVDEETKVDITPLVAIEPTIYPSDKAEDSTWSFRVKVKNWGSQSISNVKVKLQVDNAYFEAPGSEDLGTINPGTPAYASFDVHVKKSVENSPITAVVTYDAGKYDSFIARETIPATAELAQPPYGLPLSCPMIMIIATIVAGIIVGAAVILRR